MSEKPSKISIAYEGILSSKIEWDKKVLEGVTERSDLRTRVTIKNGNGRPRSDTASMGDTLIFKKLGNPFILGRQSQSNPHTETSILPNIAKAEIVLHDQIIADHVREMGKGRFDEEVFRQELARSAVSGIGEVMRWEKEMQFIESIIDSGLFTLGVAVQIGVSVAALGLLEDGVRRYFIDFLRNNSLSQGLMAVGEVVTGSSISLVGIDLVLRRVINYKYFNVPSLVTPEKSQYFQSLRDYMPAKHLRDFGRGQVYLRRNRDNVVHVKEDNSLL